MASKESQSKAIDAIRNAEAELLALGARLRVKEHVDAAMRRMVVYIQTAVVESLIYLGAEDKDSPEADNGKSPDDKAHKKGGK